MAEQKRLIDRMKKKRRGKSKETDRQSMRLKDRENDPETRRGHLCDRVRCKSVTDR